MQKNWLAALGFLVIFSLFLNLAAPLYGKPDFGDDCVSCHSEGGITLSSNVTGIIRVRNSSSFGIQISAEGDAEGLMIAWSDVANNPSFAFTPSTVADNGPQDSDPLAKRVAGTFEITAPALPASYTIQVFGAGSGGKGASSSFQVTVTTEGTSMENLLPTAYYLHVQRHMTIEFEDRSWDLDGRITSWSWDFGDNTSSTEQNPVHTFPRIDTYTVTLTVADDQGGSGLLTRTFTIPTEKERITLWSLQVAIGSAIIVFTTAFVTGIATTRKRKSEEPHSSSSASLSSSIDAASRRWRSL